MTRRRNAPRRRAPRRNARLSRNRTGIAQNPSAASRLDNVPQVRKFQIFGSVPISNASTDYALGLSNFNIDASHAPMANFLKQYAGLYEQYRIRKISVRAQVGKGFTNDLRLKTILGARVCLTNQLQGATLSHIQAINASENTSIKTLTERGNVMLATYRPRMRKRVGGVSADDPMLPSRLQWYPISYAYDHLWTGATVTLMIPDTNIGPNEVAITIIQEVVVEFRGRITNELDFVTETINAGPDNLPPADFDLVESHEDLRTKMLSGAYFPMTSDWPNIGNIGFSVAPAEIVGRKFRIQSNQEIFTIVEYNETTYGANKD